MVPNNGVGVPGEMLGSPREWMTYPDEHCRYSEMDAFWSWVGRFVHEFPGTYDEVPEAFREESAEALAHN